MESTQQELPEALRLDPIEARILGCLVEKEATTPEQYPLTENALLLACNQKTSRDPVMHLQPGEVGHALRSLEQRGLVHSRHGARVQRWEHRLAEALDLTRAQQAVLTVLMLRGAQTAGEILSRSERLHRFESAEALMHVLERLAQRSPPLVLRLPRAAGQREERWAHLLCGPPSCAAVAEAGLTGTSAEGDALAALAERIQRLEQRLAELEARLPPPAPPG